MTTFKDFMLDRNLPIQGNAFLDRKLPHSGGIVWENGDNTLFLRDYDDFAEATKSGAISFKVAAGWRVVFKLETQNGGFLGGNIVSNDIQDLSEYVQRSSGADHSGVADRDSVIITMLGGSTLDIDIDAIGGNGVHRFKLNLPDRQITSSAKINDETWLELISAEYGGQQEGGTGSGNEGVNPPSGGGITEDIDTDTYFEEGVNFSTMEFYRKDAIDFEDTTRVILNNNDIPFVKSAGILMQVAEGRYVDMVIKSENRGYFDDYSASLSIDPNARDLNLDGGDPYFTYRMYGGTVLSVDIDGEHGLGSGFSLISPTGSYTIEEFSDNEVILTITGFGDVKTRIKDDDITVDPEDDGEGDTTVVVDPDPFGLFDGYDQIVDDDAGLIDRLLGAITFGIRTSFRAIEAVIEGAFIALPAIIVIVSSLVVAKVIIKLTENGAESAIENIEAVV